MIVFWLLSLSTFPGRRASIPFDQGVQMTHGVLPAVVAEVLWVLVAMAVVAAALGLFGVVLHYFLFHRFFSFWVSCSGSSVLSSSRLSPCFLAMALPCLFCRCSSVLHDRMSS